MVQETIKELDPEEIERKAAVYEEWSRRDSSLTWKKYHAAQARKLRGMLATMERLGWYKKTANGWEKRSGIIERR